MNKSVFLDVDPTIVENNLRFANDTNEEQLNKIFSDGVSPPSKLVKPSPGFCVKSKEVGKESKVFVNICQTDSIPSPKDITEQQLEEIIESEDEVGFRIPMSIGEVRPETDKKGEEAKACDVAINPKFFEKIQTIPLFKSFLLAVVFEGLKHKHNLHCTDERVILKNRKAYGTLQMHRIEQREIDEKMGKKEPKIQHVAGGTDNIKSKPIIEELSTTTNSKVPDYRLYKRKEQPSILYGEFKLPDIISSKQLTLHIGEDRILLESNNGKYFLDVFVPCLLDQSNTTSDFSVITKVLTVTMPIVKVA